MKLFLNARACALAFALTAASSAALAQTTVKDAWVRGTVPQQMATGMFATITSTHAAKLVSASSPAASDVQIHEMLMSGDVMKMREVASIDLPAGKAVELKPGGYHLMLMGLKQMLKAGDMVAVTLVVEGADKKRQNIEVKASVRALGSGAEVHKH